MTDLEKNIRALFSFNTKSIEEKEQKLNSNVEEINKRDRTLVEKIGFVGKVDYSNLTPIERSKKENIETITLNDGSVKTIDEMFNKLLKPSQINYIVDPNERNETKILKIGELNVQFDLAKNGLNTIIDGSTKYIDTINHDRMVNSINHLYKNYIEYNQIVPKSNLLSINKLNNEIGLLEEREKNIIADLNKAYTDYYKKEELNEIKKWLSNNYNNYLKTISFCLHSEHGFIQAPMEEITEEIYLEMLSKTTPISGISFKEEDVESNQECAGGVCPIK
jgi:hypothetical protein